MRYLVIQDVLLETLAQGIKAPFLFLSLCPRNQRGKEYVPRCLEAGKSEEELRDHLFSRELHAFAYFSEKCNVASTPAKPTPLSLLIPFCT